MKKLICIILTLAVLCALCMPVFAYDEDADEYETDVLTVILCCFGGGIVVGLIVVLIMKSRMKTVRYQSRADNYADANSLQLTHRADIFLYQTVTKHP